MKLRQACITTLCASLAFASVAAAPPAGADPAPRDVGLALSPPPQEITYPGGSIALQPKVFLVLGKDSDADSERVVREALAELGVTKVEVATTAPKGQTTLWLGEAPAAVLQGLGVSSAADLDAEGYVLAVGDRSGSQRHIVIDGVDTDGTFYGAQTFRQLAEQDHGKRALPVVSIRDWPTNPYRGSIEGFYGTPWSHADRLAHLAYLGEHKMNTYMYAPKDDPYHRNRWDEPYPAAELAQLGELVTQAMRYKVDFTFALSPGLSICYTSEADVQAVIAKFQQIYDLGGRSFVVALDDIDYSVWHCDSDRAKYGTGGGAAGQAQTDLLNRIQREWVEVTPGVKPLQTTPTEYYNVTESPYKKAIREGLDSDVIVQWTGVGVVVPRITTEQAAAARAVFGHDILIWDNFPVNDYATGRLLLGDYPNRDSGIADHTVGVLSNPMNQATVSQVALYSFAEFGWNPEAYGATESYLRALTEAADGYPETLAALQLFADLNTYDGPIHTTNAPVLAGLLEEFWDRWNSGDRDGAIEGLRPRVEATIAALDVIREGVADPAWVDEAESWLRATELFGEAMAAGLDLLAALDDNDDAGAWTARQQLDKLAAEAYAIRDDKAPHSGTWPRTGDFVIPPFLAEVTELHDRALGVGGAVSASTNLPTYQDYGVEKMIDGDPATWFWSSSGTTAGDEIRVDLGEPVEIGDVRVTMGAPGHTADVISAGALEYSVDGDTWTLLTTATGATVTATAPEGTVARYVRYRATAGSNGSWLTVMEFSVEVTEGGSPSLVATATPAVGRPSLAVDARLDTSFVTDAAPADGDLLTVTLSRAADLTGVIVLQTDDAAGSGTVQALIGGTWRDVGPLEGAFTELAADLTGVTGLRIAWRGNTSPVGVAEVIPLYADAPGLTLSAAGEELTRGAASTIAVEVFAGGAAAEGTVRLEAPAGWTVTPATIDVDVPRNLSQEARFEVTAPATTPIGPATLEAVLVTSTGEVRTEIEVQVRAIVSDSNAATGRPATASSVEPGTAFEPRLAVDSDTGTRWASGYDDASWFQVDLGSALPLGKVVIRWEASFGTDYEIQLSTDGTTWTTAATVADGDGGTDVVWVNGTARYVRLQGVKRALSWGYSVYEFEVYPVDE